MGHLQTYCTVPGLPLLSWILVVEGSHHSVGARGCPSDHSKGLYHQQRPVSDQLPLSSHDETTWYAVVIDPTLGRKNIMGSWFVHTRHALITCGIQVNAYVGDSISS